MSPTILERVRKTEDLPTLPAVAVEVLNMGNRPDVSVDDLASLIMNDPALAARLLKFVNSARFGLAREIGSIKHAVVLLGMRATRMVALGFCVVDTIRSVEKSELNLLKYWRRSITTAVSSRLIAKAVTPKLAQEAFVAGLLADIGMVAICRCAPEVYGPVLNATTEFPQLLTDIESEKLGCTHATLSQELLRSWHFPERICDAVGAHHGEGMETLTGQSLQLCTLVRSAAAIAEVFSQDVPARDLVTLKSQCRLTTGIEESKLEEVLEQVDDHVREMASMLSARIGTTVDYVRLHSEAAAQWAELGLQAEAELAETSRPRWKPSPT